MKTHAILMVRSIVFLILGAAKTRPAPGPEDDRQYEHEYPERYVLEESPLEIKTRERDGVTIFDLSGDMLMSDPEVTNLLRHVQEALEKGRRNLLLIMDKVEFMDSSGFGELLRCMESTKSAGGKLKLVSKALKKNRIFGPLEPEIHPIFEIYEDEEAAVKSFL